MDTDWRRQQKRDNCWYLFYTAIIFAFIGFAIVTVAIKLGG